MKVRPLVPLLLALAVSCSGRPMPSFDTGVEGLTVSGPQCPVEVSGSPCPDEPIAAQFSITNKASGIASLVESDTHGRFRFILKPGAYTITSAYADRLPSLTPMEVVVRAHEFTRVTVRFDSGIR